MISRAVELSSASFSVVVGMGGEGGDGGDAATWRAMGRDYGRLGRDGMGEWVDGDG